MDISNLTTPQAWTLFCNLYSDLIQKHTPKEALSILHPTFGHLGWT